MSMEAASSAAPFTRFEQLRFGREVLQREGEALIALAGRLHEEFCLAVNLLYECRASVIVTGMGKAGLIGQKIAATLASTGTTAHFLHPAEAIHGDLGRIHDGDVVLALSFSGETEEIVRLLPTLADMHTEIIAVTARPDCTLAQAAAVTIALGSLKEACFLGLAPSTSTTAMLAVGDALALVVSRMRHFAAADFARFHPGGSLGRKLAKVEEVMRPLHDCRLADDEQTVREVLVSGSRPGRRTGAIMLTDATGKLTGIFTDSDLARLLETNRDADLDAEIGSLMTRDPATIQAGQLMQAALEILSARRISELPVVNDRGEPIGLIDITDLVGLQPVTDAAAQAMLSTETDKLSGPKTISLPNRPTT